MICRFQNLDTGSPHQQPDRVSEHSATTEVSFDSTQTHDLEVPQSDAETKSTEELDPFDALIEAGMDESDVPMKGETTPKDDTEDDTEDEDDSKEIVRGSYVTYKPPKARKERDFEVTRVNRRQQTANVQEVDGEETYDDVPFSELEVFEYDD